MSSADRKGAFGALAGWLRAWPHRYGLASIAVCAAVATQEALEYAIGFSHSFLLFYPTIFIVSVFAGFWPGVVSTLLFALAADYFYMNQLASLRVSDETEQIGLALFSLFGIALSWVADSLRQRTNTLQEFERVVEGLEEMIVVVDRNYRYLLANRAFLQYRGLTENEVIGRHVAEILGSAVFESTVKAKFDECFRGKVVQYEMTRRYPERGERQLQIIYLPIQGAGGIDRVARVLRGSCLTTFSRVDRSFQ